jgi:hypothetical protein
MYPAVLLIYFISAAVILLPSLALIVQVSLLYNNTGRQEIQFGAPDNERHAARNMLSLQ